MLYLGAGVSGGEEGALKGPSIMPGGSEAAWLLLKPIFQTISAQTDSGEPCCDWVGGDGSGHFVKMVHNGIEYGDMQMICEVYQMMKVGLGLSNAQMADHFDAWNQAELNSYLIEITRDILAYTTDEGEAVVDAILDTAGQKERESGRRFQRWIVGKQTLIGEAVFARCLSALKEERVKAARVLKGPDTGGFEGDIGSMVEDLKQALYASKIVSYAQGYQLMRAAAEEHGWTLNNGGIALMWRGGCIIRSAFLGRIKEAFDRDPALTNLLLIRFSERLLKKRAVAACGDQSDELGIAMPAVSAAPIMMVTEQLDCRQIYCRRNGIILELIPMSGWIPERHVFIPIGRTGR